MASSVPDLMARLRQSSARLNELSDEAAATVKAAEEFLTKECSVGIEGRVTVSCEECSEYATTEYLGFERWGGKFRILVINWHSSDPEETSKAWADCDRKTKIRTIAFLPELLEEIANLAEKKVETIESALSTVESLIGTLPQKKKKGE